MTTITDLIERLEKAEGPSRELDADIAVAFDFVAAREWWSCDYIKHGMIRNFTGSIDAAVALAERVLPGWTIAAIGQDDRKGWHAELREGHRTSYSTVALAGAPNGAIALCLATLKARAVQENRA